MICKVSPNIYLLHDSMNSDTQQKQQAQQGIAGVPSPLPGRGQRRAGT